MYQITIDGLSGSGKSSVARKVAEKLDIMYFDTDIVIDCISSELLIRHINPTSEEKILDYLRDAKIEVVGKGDDMSVIIDGIDDTNKINNPVVRSCGYTLGKQEVMAKYIRILQLKCAQNNDLVVEGFNSGVTLFPKARFKFFLTADSSVRAKRKYEALVDKGITDYKYEDILKDTEDSDRQYFNGEMAKIDVSEETHFIDTSENTAVDTANEIINIIRGEK